MSFKKWKHNDFHKEDQDTDFLAQITDYIEDFELDDPEWEADYFERLGWLKVNNNLMYKIFKNFRQLKAEYQNRLGEFKIVEANAIKKLRTFPQNFHMSQSFDLHVLNYFNNFDEFSEWWVVDCCRRIKEMHAASVSPSFTATEKEMYRQRGLVFGEYIKQSFLIFYTVKATLINEQMFLPLKHLLPLFGQTVKVLDGEEKKKITIINIFSGAGKTDGTNSIVEYEYARNVDAVILHISASDALLKQNAERIRKTCMHDYFGFLFGHKLYKKDRSKSTQWAFNTSTKAYNYMARTYGSAFLGASAGGTDASKLSEAHKAYMSGGMGLEDAYEQNIKEITKEDLEEFVNNKSTGGLLLLDDPQEEGKAPSEYQSDWDDFIGKVLSRARGTTKILLNQQRVHANDLSGQIMLHMKGEFVSIRVPVFNKDFYLMKDTRTGDPIREYSVILRVMMAKPSIFACMYQNSPLADEGDLFKREVFHKYAQEPDSSDIKKIFITADTAMVADDKSDYTVICLWGITKHDRLYLLDMQRGKWEGLDLVKTCGDIWIKWCTDYHKKISFFIEAISGGLMTKQICNQLSIPVKAMKRKSKETKVSKKVHLLMPTAGNVKGKVERVKLIKDTLELNHVWIRNDYFNDFMQECINFRRDGKHRNDDMVDCLTDAVFVGYSSRGGGSMTTDVTRKLGQAMNKVNSYENKQKN